MATILLSSGEHTIIDDEDFELLNSSKWHLSSEKSVRRNKSPHLMHRIITNAPPDMEVEHINRNRLDNRRSNLRLTKKAWRGRNVDDKRWLNSKMQPSGDCMFFTGYVNPTGYCKIRFRGKIQQAHRVSYIVFKGEIADDMQIDHLCRNRACIRPEHLEAVTREENMARVRERNEQDKLIRL